MNLHHLRLFRAVATEGSLTRAAEKLNLSQSALSTQIRALEAALGHDLFERQGRRLVLTEAGRIALDHADAIFLTVEDLSAVMRERGLARRAVRVGALATLSRNFQMAFLRPLVGRDVEVILRSGSQAELLRDLEALALDVVLTNLAPPREGGTAWQVHPIGEQPVSLIGTPRRAAGLAMEPLLRSQPLVLPTKDSALRGAFDALMARFGITPRIAAEADDMAMLRLLAREDAGLAVIPPIVVRDELSAGTLVEVAQLDGIREHFMAVTRPRRFPHPVVEELLRGDADSMLLR